MLIGSRYLVVFLLNYRSLVPLAIRSRLSLLIPPPTKVICIAYWATMIILR